MYLSLQNETNLITDPSLFFMPSWIFSTKWPGKASQERGNKLNILHHIFFFRSSSHFCESLLLTSNIMAQKMRRSRWRNPFWSQKKICVCVCACAHILYIYGKTVLLIFIIPIIKFRVLNVPSISPPLTSQSNFHISL